MVSYIKYRLYKKSNNVYKKKLFEPKLFTTSKMLNKTV